MASYYSGAGDGSVYQEGESWEESHNTSVGDSTSSSLSTTGYVTVYYNNDTWADFGRGFFPIDTTNVEHVISATLYISSITNYDYTYRALNYMAIVLATQNSTSSLSVNDFDQCGSIDNPTKGSNSINCQDLIAGYNAYTLNTEGISWINSSGYTKFGLRCGFDIEDSPPDVDWETWGIKYSSSEDTSGTKDPYLDVTVIQTYAIFQFKDYSPVGNEQGFNVTWQGQTSLAPSTSPVVLQIYNFDTLTWVNLAQNVSSDVNTDFELSAWIGDSGEDISAYHNSANMICCRVYQGG